MNVSTDVGYVLRRSSIDHQEGMIFSPQDGSGQNVFFSFDDLNRVLVPNHFVPQSSWNEVNTDGPSTLPCPPPTAYALPRAGAPVRSSPPRRSPHSGARSPYARPTHSARGSMSNSDEEYYSHTHASRERSQSLNSSVDSDELANFGSLSRSSFGPPTIPIVPAADQLRTELAREPLTIHWMPSLGRAVSPKTAMTGTGEAAVRIVFGSGEWHRTFDGEGEIAPWMNPNGWIKGQLKHTKECICGFQWFKNGKQLRKQQDAPAIFKRPAVCREHIASCRKRPADDPLAAVCRWTRDADRRKGNSTKSRSSWIDAKDESE